MPYNKTDQEKCHFILAIPKIRFAGFLDYMGNLIVGDSSQEHLQ
ncbi:hypothetical protein NPIRD3C_0795 [Nitrosopumilus piranensis]|uniref:Uncharacterized protein n=1 Tax=Nitrosopumilus piranensis TaxID=1582439 RepID=A0A0C5CA27_9ARCH|nr:hypothetical protein NPIRD3C_0795 [Nitrosopumilus piranensis]